MIRKKKRSTILYIATGAIAINVAAFWFLADKRPTPKVTPVEEPNFRAREKEFVDEKTGEKIIVREFTVSTKLAPVPNVPPGMEDRQRAK